MGNWERRDRGELGEEVEVKDKEATLWEEQLAGFTTVTAARMADRKELPLRSLAAAAVVVMVVYGGRN